MSQKMKSFFLLIAIYGTLSVVIVIPAFSRANPQLNSIQPLGGQRGQDVEITLTGTGLEGVTSILLSQPGVQAMIKDWKQDHGRVSMSGEGLSGKISGSQQLKVLLKLPPSASLDPLQLRVQTAHGVSNPIAFYVDDLQEVHESEPNPDFKQANKIDLPVVINGVISPEGDEDHFVFQATEGQRLIFEVQASRIGSQLDSYLTLYDTDENPVARNDLYNGLDSLIDYTVKKSGVYRLVVQDLRYKGGNRYFYRLRAGALPYVDSLFPLGGRCGEESTVSIQGRNLEDISQFQVAIEPSAPRGIRNVRVTTPSGLSSNACAFMIDDLPERIEKEPNSVVEEAESITVPVSLNGRIEEEDEDIFSFTAQAGQRLIFEVFAQRLGSPLDSVLILMDEQGKTLKVSDDNAGTDPRLEHTFEQEGKYSIAIRELNRGGGGNHAYRLSIHPPRPDFSMSVSPQNPRVYAGASVPLTVVLNGQDGFNAPAQLKLVGAPAGSTLEPSELVSRQGASIVTLHVPESAQAQLYHLSLIAESTLNGERVQKAIQPSQIDLTVMDKAPFILDIVDLDAQLTQGKGGSIRVKTSRRNGFEGPIQLSVLGLPNNVSANTPALNTDQEHADINLYAAGNAAVGNFNITIMGSASQMNEPIEIAASAIQLRVAEAPFVLDTEPKRLSIPLLAQIGGESAAVQGIDDATPEVGLTEEVEIKVSVSRRGYFTGAVQLEALNPPEGIMLNIPEIPAGEEEIVVKLSGRANLKPDTYRIQLIGRTEVNNRSFEQNAPRVDVKFITVEITTSTE